MKSLLISGRCPYNTYQEQSLQSAGVDASIYKEWGIHLPDHTDDILSQKPDIIHLQWPESLTQQDTIDHQKILDDFAVCLPRLKSEGAVLFWVMHNLLPHARQSLNLWQPLFELFAEHCDVCHHHSQCGQEAALKTYDYGTARHELLYHGYFDEAATSHLDQAAARKQLGLPADAHIYLAIGSLRPDKYIKETIDCFKGRASKNDILFMAGNVYTDYGKEMVAYGETLDNVIIKEGYIEDADVSLYANASDAFLYLYGETHLTSGSPHMSQAHLLPQITLDYAYAREVLGDGSIYIPTTDQRYQHLIQLLDDLDTEQLHQQRQWLIDHRQPWHWSQIAQQTKAAYQRARNS